MYLTKPTNTREVPRKERIQMGILTKIQIENKPKSIKL